MRALTKPEFSAETVFLASISRVKNKELKQRLEDCLNEIIRDATDYDLKATEAKLHLLQKKTILNGNVTRKEMEAVYTDRFAKLKTPGRHFYDKLKETDDGKCPLCNQLPVKTLDHHLAKSDFPSLALSPNNLVPACSDCNTIKKAAFPTSSEEETLHPYFDNIEDDQWLFADVLQTYPISMNFFIKPPTQVTELLAHRVLHHFNFYKLNTLYKSEAASELRNIAYQMRNLFELAGPEAVKEQLIERSESSFHDRLNSWKSAMYQALSNDNWYITTGIQL
ncbi:HNH endonuclease [Paenibacillus marchantiae]|uniref:HNH endonuclease n=1 Tax=Paenibacillus marchantiae TaxID=3026433 RepID=UPI00237B4A40|nr:HNH endonuclease [Paenibacillus marchantiae]WDQ32179.1 HNH endonuclease [Paenibacillus marchantiae]